MRRRGLLPGGEAAPFLALAAVAAVGAWPSGAAAAPADRSTPVVAVSARSGIVLVDPAGGERTAVPDMLPGDDAPALAPDGRRLAFSSGRSGNRELYVLDLWTQRLTRLTANRRAVDTAPTWSPTAR